MAPESNQMIAPRVTEVIVDLRANALRFALDRPIVRDHQHQPGTVEIGSLGRLLGLELGEDYLAISDGDPATSHLVRTADVTVTMSDDGCELSIPRFGEGWELSFPSGNQCWRVGSGADGRSVCSVVRGRPG